MWSLKSLQDLELCLAWPDGIFLLPMIHLSQKGRNTGLWEKSVIGVNGVS